MRTIQVPFFSSGGSLSDDVIYTVGRIVRCWSAIEFTVDSSIRDLLNRPDTRNLNTALVLPFRQRTDLLKKLLAEVVQDAASLAKLNSIIDQITSLQNYRDFVVHGNMVDDAKRPTTHVYLSRSRWSNPITVRRTFLRKSKLVEIENKIVQAMMELFMATAGCHDPAWKPSLDIMRKQTQLR
jgi:hypothetical protein